MGLDVLGYFGLCFEVLDACEFAGGDFGGGREGRPHEVLDARGDTGVGDGAALRDFGVGGHGFPVVCYGEDAVGVGYCGGEGGGGGEVCGDDFAAFGGEVLGGRFGCVAGYGADGVFACEGWVGEEDGDDGPALVAGGAEDGEDFLRHDERFGVWLVIVVLVIEMDRGGPGF